MDDRPAGRQTEIRSDPAASREGRGGASLSWKLLLLTVLFVMLSEVLIYVPSIANFRLSWLADRLTMADTASVVIVSSSAEASRQVQNDLLAAVGATAIAIRNGSTSRLIATVEMPPEVDIVADLRMMDPVRDAVDAFATLTAGGQRMLRVIGMARSGAVIEIVLDDRALRAAMLRYSVNILWLSALISVITGGLLYFAMNRLLVRPMRQLSQNMVAFSNAPENPARIIVPSGRADEIGVAEEQLAAMQRDLQATLSEQRHLADLGLAVSKINHDLRNMLASAQLFSDRLGSLPDPTVQRFAPKLIAALDRAITYTQSTLVYGRAREAAPERRLVALARLIDDVADALGLVGHATVAFENRVPAGLEIDADPEQLFRVLVNLCRNAVQALDGDQSPAVVRRLSVGGRRDGMTVSITVSDTGPGVPDRARAHLFQAFQGGARPGGTGLGLAIAAEIVRAHGGALALVDTPGPGATFEITLPDRTGRNGRNGRNGHG
jgi:signal transduction histidine kinase